MEVKIVKSCGMWVRLRKKDECLDLKFTFRDHPLKIVAKEAPVHYLVFFQSPDGCWKDTSALVPWAIQELNRVEHPVEGGALSYCVNTIVRSEYGWMTV